MEDEKRRVKRTADKREGKKKNSGETITRKKVEESFEEQTETD